MINNVNTLRRDNMNIIKSVSITLVAAFALVGCASTHDYTMYAQGQAQIEAARYAAEAARFKAMSDIAATGDASAKVAAVVALALSNGNGGQNSPAQLKAPEAPGQTALAWASIFVPALTQGYSIYSNTRLGMAQSNNSARVAESTNSSFLGMANQIQTAGAAGNAALVTLGTSSNTAITSVASASTQALTTLSTSSNQSFTSLAGLIQSPQPNVSYTLSGTGVLGNGTYSTTANSLGGNGVIGSGSYSTQQNPVLSGTGVIGSGTHNPSTPTTTTTTTPAPVVITPVVTTPPVVITPVNNVTPVVITPVNNVTPVIVVPPATPASAP
jgi:hypothetical protein